MKQKAAFLVVALALLVAIVMSGKSYVNSAIATGNNHVSSSAFTADDGYPTPPPPVPITPPSGQPSLSPTLRADGGYPTPPPPVPITPPSGNLNAASALVL